MGNIVLNCAFELLLIYKLVSYNSLLDDFQLSCTHLN